MTALWGSNPRRGGVVTATVPVNRAQRERQLIKRYAAIFAAKLSLGAAVIRNRGVVAATSALTVAFARDCQAPSERQSVDVHTSAPTAGLALWATVFRRGHRFLAEAVHLHQVTFAFPGSVLCTNTE